MDLLESHARELFARYGVAVLAAGVADPPRQPETSPTVSGAAASW
jgi:hypothetical protein